MDSVPLHWGNKWYGPGPHAEEAAETAQGLY